MSSYRNKKGFTIIELLIVIMVVAILSGIFAVVYGGIRQRADNAAIVSAARSSYKLLQLYIQGEGKGPAVSSACFGENPDTNGDGVGDCGGNGSTTQSNGFNDELSKYGVLPHMKNMPVVVDENGRHRGIVYYYNSPTRLVDGVSNSNFIIYYLAGSVQDCGNANVVKDNGGSTWSTGTGQKYTYSSSGRTSCYVVVK